MPPRGPSQLQVHAIVTGLVLGAEKADPASGLAPEAEKADPAFGLALGAEKADPAL